MRVAVVSTSINKRPKIYAQWADVAHLIVAGDLNSPPELERFVVGLGGSYLRPDDQTKRFTWSEDVGWNCIQRRNAAIATALDAGYDYIVTVDDDNYPAPSAAQFITGHLDQFTPPSPDARKMFTSSSGFLNTGDFCIPQFNQRGNPHGVPTFPVLASEPEPQPRVVVSQAQILGDPDCDAMERICYGPNVVAVSTEALIAPGVYAAFNTQATVWAGDWAPVMACLPGVGRYDDIFAAFIFARLARTYNVTLHVGTPVMRQVRNVHDLNRDLRDEYWGVRNTQTFCRLLDDAHISADMPLWVAYDELIVATASLLPQRTVRFARDWVIDWKGRS